jgi:excisionase family DNA binding protein
MAGARKKKTAEPVEEPAPAPKPEFYTVQEVAVRLRVSKMTVYRMVRSGLLDGKPIGRGLRIAAASVDHVAEHGTAQRKAVA